MRRAVAVVAVMAAVTLSAPSGAAAWSGQCTRYEPLIRLHAPRIGWDVDRMSYYMWRESRCLPHVENVGRTTVATGLLQVHSVTWPYLSARTGVPTWAMRAWLKDPGNNIRAAAILARYAHSAWGDRYRPWRLI